MLEEMYIATSLNILYISSIDTPGFTCFFVTSSIFYPFLLLDLCFSSWIPVKQSRLINYPQKTLQIFRILLSLLFTSHHRDSCVF